MADPSPLVSGDPLACFNRIDGAATLSTVAVSGMPFTRALHVKTGAVSATANAWDIRPRCFSTLAARQNDVVAVTFWMRAIAAPDGRGLTSFVLERNDSPYTKSVTYTAAAGSDWKLFEVPFTMAETYAANAYNFSFWVTFPNQEIEIGGLSILDYGPGVPFSELGLSTWPYAERAADAPWRAAAAARIDRYRKGDLAVIVRDDSGKPIPGAAVHVKMNRHAFGFGTAVAGDILQSSSADGQNYRSALKKLFNKVVTENVLKWPPFESWGRAQADYMLPWFAANGFAMVRGHNVIWPAATYLPADVQNMLKANPRGCQRPARARQQAHRRRHGLQQRQGHRMGRAQRGLHQQGSAGRARRCRDDLLVPPGPRRRPRRQALHQRLQHPGIRRLRPAAHQRLRRASSGTCSPPERPSTASGCNRTSIPT